MNVQALTNLWSSGVVFIKEFTSEEYIYQMSRSDICEQTAQLYSRSSSQYTVCVSYKQQFARKGIVSYALWEKDRYVDMVRNMKAIISEDANQPDTSLTLSRLSQEWYTQQNFESRLVHDVVFKTSHVYRNQLVKGLLDGQYNKIQ